jgi:hypothetical protein
MKRIAIAGAVLALAVPSLALAQSATAPPARPQPGSQPSQTSQQPAGQAATQPMAGARGEATVTINGKKIAVDYGRPSLKGRDMLAQAKVGEAWRMGMNEATTLKTDADIAFGQKTVPKGEYVLTATKVDGEQWMLNILSKADRSKVADVPLTTEKLPQSVEQFTIELAARDDSGTFRMSWGTVALGTTFTLK